MALRPPGVPIATRPGIAPRSGVGVVTPFGQKLTLPPRALSSKRFIHQPRPAGASSSTNLGTDVDKPVESPGSAPVSSLVRVTRQPDHGCQADSLRSAATCASRRMAETLGLFLGRMVEGK